MKRTALAAMMMLVNAGVGAQVQILPPATQPPGGKLAPPAKDPVAESAKAAIARYLDCVVDQAQRLDDFRSDASTIARGAMGACSQLAEGAAMLTARTDPYRLDRARTVITDNGLELGTTAVLRHRRDARSAPAPAPAKPIPKGEGI
jgi:hypothetical protein